MLEQHAGLFSEALPNLRTLEIINGFFSLQSRNLFHRVEKLVINATIDPLCDEMLDEDQMLKLRDLTLA